MSVKDNILALWKQSRPDIKSIAELERKMNVSNGSVKKWGNSTPSTQSLKKVADFFHVPVNVVIDSPSKNSGAVNSKTVELLAAHMDEGLSPLQIQEIINFIEFQKQKIEEKESKGNE